VKLAVADKQKIPGSIPISMRMEIPISILMPTENMNMNMNMETPDLNTGTIIRQGKMQHIPMAILPGPGSNPAGSSM